MLDDSLPFLTIGYLMLDDAFLENRKGFLVSNMFYVFRKYLVPITKFPFHVFDRYEINIQALVHFINGRFIISRSSSPHNHFPKMFIFTKKNQTQHKQQQMAHRTYTFRKFPKCSESKIDKHNVFPR